MRTISAIIIDDEVSAQDTLCSLLDKFVPFVLVTGRASGIQNAKALLGSINTPPDLVFLDIQLGKDMGLDLIKSFDPSRTKIVITSAYSSFGLDAAKKGVSGYLEKPIDVDELTEICMQIANQKRSKSEPELSKLFIPTRSSYEAILVEEIEMLEADNNYTRFYLSSKRTFLASRSLKHFENLLISDSFFRVHKSYIVNINHIVRISKGVAGTIYMKSGVKSLISKHKRKEFISILSNGEIS